MFVFFEEKKETEKDLTKKPQKGDLCSGSSPNSSNLFSDSVRKKCEVRRITSGILSKLLKTTSRMLPTAATSLFILSSKSTKAQPKHTVNPPLIILTTPSISETDLRLQGVWAQCQPRPGTRKSHEAGPLSPASNRPPLLLPWPKRGPETLANCESG